MNFVYREYEFCIPRVPISIKYKQLASLALAGLAVAYLLMRKYKQQKILMTNESIYLLSHTLLVKQRKETIKI